MIRLSDGAASLYSDLSSLTETILARCTRLAQSSEDEGQLSRTFLSRPMEECQHLLSEWMQQAGMTVWLDSVGNLHGLRKSTTGSGRRLLIGSHLDTIPNAGAYDGVLGVLLGLALVEVSEPNDYSFDIEVIGFSEEEGVRYNIPFLGSRGLVEGLPSAMQQATDAQGISMEAALRAFIAAHPDALPAKLHPDTFGYLEFHIEQGPVLESLDVPLAVVETIAGQSRAIVSFQGKANHAGTTPMHLRNDALVAAADWITSVNEIAAAIPGLVATVGQIHCWPGATNVIPGHVQCSLDVRHADDTQRAKAVGQLSAEAAAIGAKRSIQICTNISSQHPATLMNATMTELALSALAQADYPAIRMVSGAGHDAMILAAHIPTTMIFLRSPGGISHHPDEAVLKEDVEAALKAGIEFLRNLHIHSNPQEH